MKIAEVKADMEVGVIKGRKADYRELPRRALVVEIVTREEKQWSQFSDEVKTINRKMVKVRLLDEPLTESSGYYSNIHTLAQGHETVIEPAQIVGPWATLRQKVLDEVAARQAKKDGQDALNARLVAIFGKRRCESFVTARFDGRGRESELSFYGPTVQTVLEALEFAQAQGAL